MRFRWVRGTLYVLGAAMWSCSGSSEAPSIGGADAGGYDSPPERGMDDASVEADAAEDRAIFDGGSPDDARPPDASDGARDALGEDAAIDATPARYAVGGTVNGLSGSGLSVQLGTGETLAIAGDGSFAFPALFLDGAPFAVTVKTQPSSPTELCVVTGGTGTIAGADVDSVRIDCTVSRFAVGGTLSGVVGSVLLQNGGGDDLALSADGPFQFASNVASGQAYSVTVAVQPFSQTCVVTNGNGIVGGADVSDVRVVCERATRTIGGTITGLSPGHGTVVLENNGGDDLTLSADGPFTFATPVTKGSSYSVTVVGHSANVACMVSGANGTAISDVSSVMVLCGPPHCKALQQIDPGATSGIHSTVAGDGTHSVFCDMTSAGGGWTQVFDQDITVGTGYQPAATWLAGVNPSAPNSGQYSILNRLNELKSGNTFEFRIEWPVGPSPGSVQWTQVEDPRTSGPTPTIGSVVESPPNQTGCGPFMGLARPTMGQPTALSADSGTCWWWAIGTEGGFRGGIPGYESPGSGVGTPHARLWVR